MGIRRSIANILLGPPEVTADDLRQVRDAASASAPSEGSDSETDAKIAKLEKKLNMAMGAVQAATAQIMSLKKDVQELVAASSQASQTATTARATAESTADGLSGVEEQLAALIEKLGKAQEGTPPKKKGSASKKKSASPTTCKVDGCNDKHRAKGFCARHYQQHKRGTLG